MNPEDKVIMQQVASETAKKTVQETLLALGLDTDHPIEVQKDLATLREVRSLIEDPEWQADQLHLRKWRKTVNAVESKGIFAAFKFVMIGVFTLALIGAGVKFGIFN